MTDDYFSSPSRGLIFLDDAPRLPLIDATAAAERVGMQRHTLACYRNLGNGPRWFKIGKWPRYTAEDLDCWLAGQPLRLAHLTIGAVWPVDQLDQALVHTAVAARILSVSRHCMASYRADGAGPAYRHAGRRVFYALGGLLDWTVAQRR